MELLGILLPAWYVHTAAFGFGVIIGSFLNVYIYRLHTGKSLSGSSHCLSCGHRLRAWELVPLLSYVALRGRCSSCKSKITPRYFIVELLTAGLFALALLAQPTLLGLLLLWFVLAVLVVVFVYDYYHFIIPDELTLATLVGAAALLGLSMYRGYPLQSAAVDVAAAVAGAAFFWVLWRATSGRALGFGDVKLAVPLGLLVGAYQVFSFVVLSFWIGAVVSLVMLAYQRWSTRGQQRLRLQAKALTMKSAIPFAPFLIVSCLLVYFTHFDVLTIFSF